MKLITSEGLTTEPVSMVLTGDGRTDLRVLKLLALKYNGRKILFYPKIPLVRKGTDVFADLLNPIDSIVEKYRKITKFLIIIDREHVSTGNELSAKLKKFKLRIHHHETIDDVVHIIKGMFGGREIIVYIVLCGIKWCLEEEIAKLIEIRYKTKVTASSCRELKINLRRFEKEHNKKLETIIEEASKKELECAFDGLTYVLKLLEKE